MSENCALIVAGGKGRRMGASKNKLFLNINGKPILAYTLEVFENNELIDDIILVLSESDIEYCKKEIILKYSFKKISKIVIGGSERQESVLNGLRAAENCDVILIHDGARPFVSNKIIEDGIKYAKVHGACACGVEPKDTIKIKDNNGFSITTPKRSELFCVQTPQCFKYELILNSHEKVLKKGLMVTDDTMVAEACGFKVFLYEGSYNNIKLTTPEDLTIGEKILENISLT